MTATSTLANLPVLSSVQTSTWSINVNWTANGNSAGTLYTAKNITTNNSLTSSNTYWLDTTSLSPNTTYQYEVQAINNNSISTAWVIYNSTSTLAVTPPAPSLVNVSSTGISIAINTDANPYYTNYAIQISSWGGWTGYVNTSGALVGAAVYATTTTWTASRLINGLTPNTTFAIGISAQNSNLVPTVYGAVASTATYAAIPSNIATGAVSSSTTVISWNANGNPSNTRYELYCSSDNFVNIFSTPVALAQGFTANTTAVYLLTPNTTYWFKLCAFQQTTGISSAYSSVVSTVTWRCRRRR